MSDDRFIPPVSVEWHLLMFDRKTERLVTEVHLSDAQFQALKPFLGMVDNDMVHFGSYPLEGVDAFVEAWVL